MALTLHQLSSKDAQPSVLVVTKVLPYLLSATTLLSLAVARLLITLPGA